MTATVAAPSLSPQPGSSSTTTLLSAHVASLSRAAPYAIPAAGFAAGTIGGNIATNAGGLHCVKYGVTRESVLGLTIVVAEGTVLRTGRQTIKGVVGYDLTALFIGSEGTLGIIVEAVVRLRPRPPKTRTAVAFFPTTAAASAGLTATIRSRAQPSVLELLDAGALAGIDQAQGTELFRRGNAQLIVKTDGFGADGEIEAIGQALIGSGGDVEFLDDEAGEHYLWLRRHGRSFSADSWFIGEDVAVPRSALGAMLDAIERIGRQHGLATAVVAHAGDGNLHPLLSLAKNPSDGGIAPSSLHTAADELIRTAISLGGTISGEHGVGITKRPWIEQELGAASLDLQRRIKAAFDPQDILNPHTWLAHADRPLSPGVGSLTSRRSGRRLTTTHLDAYGEAR